MAIIRTARRNSGTETVLKVLDILTEDIDLVRGKILMSEFQEDGVRAVKLSLFIYEDNFSYIGARNVWIRNVKNGIAICYADAVDAPDFLMALRRGVKWDAAFPSTHQYYYELKDLDTPAHHLRNYLLLGALPSIQIPETYQKTLDIVLKKIEFDVLATFDPHLLKYPEK
jgi:glycosyltransferase involved in cell wall biosynthesis